SIALYILSGFARTEERSQEAGIKYLLLGAFASGFLLYGMALIYGETGHTQLGLIQAALQANTGTEQDPLFLVGVVLLFIGLAFKISAAPFHTWTPDVYQGAPVSVTTFMSVATKVAAFAAIAVITVMSGRGEDIDSYDSIRGLFYRRPYVAAAMALFLFSLGGFPPTAGFIAKFLVFSAAVHSGNIGLAFWGIATSALSVFYYLRIGLLMFSR